MPSIFEVGFVTGFGPGLLTGGLLYALLQRLPTRTAEPDEAHPPISVYGAPLFERTFRALPTGMELREVEKPYSVGKDETIIIPLLRLILNEYSGGGAVPRTGVPLTWRTCQKWGMKRAGWQALCEYVYPGRGYLAPGPGGKLVTVLAAARAREFVEKARKAGRVGTPPFNESAFPEL